MSSADLHRLVDSLPEDVARRIENGVPTTLVVSREQGRLTVREIDPQQAWFWTPEWLEGERDADAQIASGEGAVYDSDDDFLGALEVNLKPLE